MRILSEGMFIRDALKLQGILHRSCYAKTVPRNELKFSEIKSIGYKIPDNHHPDSGGKRSFRGPRKNQFMVEFFTLPELI